MNLTPDEIIGTWSHDTSRRDPGVPWKTNTGGPFGSPDSSHASSRPSGRSITTVSPMFRTVSPEVGISPDDLKEGKGRTDRSSQLWWWWHASYESGASGPRSLRLDLNRSRAAI